MTSHITDNYDFVYQHAASKLCWSDTFSVWINHKYHFHDNWYSTVVTVPFSTKMNIEYMCIIIIITMVWWRQNTLDHHKLILWFENIFIANYGQNYVIRCFQQPASKNAIFIIIKLWKLQNGYAFVCHVQVIAFGLLTDFLKFSLVWVN